MLNLNPKYIGINQRSYCCVAASLLMILKRRCINKNLSQEDIACDLGLIVPVKDKELFDSAIVSDVRPRAGYGTQIHKNEFSLENFFIKNSLDLKCDFVYCKDLEDFKKFIVGNIKKNKDMIVCFNYSRLYGVGNNGGHVSLIEGLDGDEVILMDPDSKYLPKQKIVALDSLADAIGFHEKEIGGLWVISDR